jgi:CheY-like chemotaxis protein
LTFVVETESFLLMSKKIKILIVEDDLTNTFLLSEFFDKPQYELNSVDNGLAAIKFIESHPDTNLILMDLKIPGLNGIEATKRIKAMNPLSVIVAQTAYSNSETKVRAAEAGADAFFSKPINFDELSEFIAIRFGL